MIPDLNNKTTYKDRFALILLIIAATILRFYKLDDQSLWHDELFTLSQANPQLSWSETFRLISLDTHPPLYVVVSKIMYMLLGYTPWAARCTAALAGVATVPVMYAWGKYMADKRLGLIAAAIACVAHFSIVYSQEGRDYSMLMVFSALSVYCFMRLTTEFSAKAITAHVLSSALLIYTHYYGFLVLAAEALVVLFLLLVKNKRKQTLVTFTFSFLFIGICYLPWLPSMFKVKEVPAIVTEHMVVPSITFPLHHYYDFFGATIYIAPFLLLLPAIFMLYLFRERKAFKGPGINKQVLFLLLLLSCFLIGNGLPYIGSLWLKPMITPRYMIFLLPLYSMLLAWGVWLIRNKMARYTVLFAFLFISLYNTICVSKHYTSLYREQVREITAFVVGKGNGYPMINEWMAWRQQYYLKKYHYTGTILNYDGSIWPTKHNKEWMVDSILAHSGSYNVDTFWILVVNEDQPLSKSKQKHLDTAFAIIQEAHFINSNAWLYGRKQ